MYIIDYRKNKVVVVAYIVINVSMINERLFLIFPLKHETSLCLLNLLKLLEQNETKKVIFTLYFLLHIMSKAEHMNKRISPCNNIIYVFYPS